MDIIGKSTLQYLRVISIFFHSRVWTACAIFVLAGPGESGGRAVWITIWLSWRLTVLLWNLIFVLLFHFSLGCPRGFWIQWRWRLPWRNRSSCAGLLKYLKLLYVHVPDYFFEIFCRVYARWSISTLCYSAKRFLKKYSRRPKTWARQMQR